MCGLAGFAGIKNAQKRLNLVLGLGIGIDTRGKDASGYLAISKGTPKYNKKLGTWQDAKFKFWNSASKSDLCMMHARYATCGNKGIDEAHPFAIWRNNRVVLWGAHNGMIYSAREAANKNGRKFSVDSKELFEIYADRDYEQFRNQTGYGVINWIEADQRDRMFFARLSSNSDFVVYAIEGGGVVWGSTEKIVKNALELADLRIKMDYDIKEVGRVYYANAEGVFVTETKDLCFKSNSNVSYSGYSGVHYGHYGSYNRDRYMDDDDDMKYSNWAKKNETKNSNNKSSTTTSSTSTTNTTKNDTREKKLKSVNGPNLSSEETDILLKENNLHSLYESWEALEKDLEEEEKEDAEESSPFRNFLD